MATFDPKEVFVVLGFDKLREVVGDLDQNFLAFVIGDLTIGDGDGGLYHWIEDRTTADDGAETIVPPTQLPARRGCWRRMFGYGATEGSRVVNSITELRALDGNTSSLQSVVMSGYASAGDGGGGTWIWTTDTTSTDNTGTIVVTSTSPRAGCWKRVSSGPWNVLWWGAVADNATDNITAFQNAIDACEMAFAPNRGRSLFVPSGQYYFSQTIRITNRINIIGDHGSSAGGGTYLRFAASKTGIYIGTGSGVDGSFSTISQLTLVGGGGSSVTAEGTSTQDTTNVSTMNTLYASAHGVHLNAQATLHEVFVTGFAGNGFHVYANFDVVGTSANTSAFYTCYAYANSGNGFHFQGPDSNACTTIRASSTDNGGWGIFEGSFLGNFHGGAHVDSNTSGGFTTDSNPNNYSVFSGCYVEPGQTCAVSAPAMIVGGHHNGTLGDSVAQLGKVFNTDIEIRPDARSDQPGATRDRILLGVDGDAFYYDPADTSEVPLRIKYYTSASGYGQNGWFTLNVGNTDSDNPIAVSGENAAETRSLCWLLNGTYLGNGGARGFTSYRLMPSELPNAAANTVTAQGTRQGDFFFQGATGTNDGILGYACTGSGTPAQYNPVYKDRRVVVDRNTTTNNKVVTESTTSRTLADTDDNVTILCTNVGAITITAPSTLTKGTIVRLVQAAAGQITVVGSGGVVIRVPTGRAATSRALYSCVEVEMIGSLDAEVRGDLTGIGDVLGPASSTDNAIVRFDSTTGKLVQNSGVLVDDSANLVLPKTSGVGVKVDVASPTFAWADIIGNLDPKTSGAGTPTLNAFRGGNVNVFSFAANDLADMQFHIPHDYLPGSDIYIHVHWAHNGTAISGSFVCDFFHTYQKGHNQGDFPAEKTLTLTVSTPDIATIPQYRHRVDEVQLSAASPSAAQIDSDDLEPDGVILMRMRTTTIPTITGSVARNEPYIFFVDIHYQTTGVIGTKAKSPGFWT